MTHSINTENGKGRDQPDANAQAPPAELFVDVLAQAEAGTQRRGILTGDVNVFGGSDFLCGKRSEHRRKHGRLAEEATKA